MSVSFATHFGMNITKIGNGWLGVATFADSGPEAAFLDSAEEWERDGRERIVAAAPGIRAVSIYASTFERLCKRLEPYARRIPALGELHPEEDF